MSNQNNKQKLHCPRFECKGSGEFQYLGEEKSITVVNEDGKVVYSAGSYIYKCMSCSMTFKSDLSPQTKRLLNG